MKQLCAIFSSILALFSLVLHNVYSKADIHIGYRLSLAVPVDYTPGFIGRALLMETQQPEPNFKVAISVESFVQGRFSCSLEVFLGDVKVWNSGHYSPFFPTDKCVIELAEDGELQLKGENDRLGWRSGTSAQGVEKLVIMTTGNLVLVDAIDRVKWQSFNFPTDVILWGQRLNVATRLASFPSTTTAANSTAFYYTFEIHRNRIALHLISGKMNYSYWEFKPTKNRNITFIKLASKALELYNDENQKIAQIQSGRIEPLRFLSLSNGTGNLGFYFYSPEERKFSAAFQSLSTTCDLPSACKPYGICTSSSNSCSCIRLSNKELGCSEEASLGLRFCGGGEEEEEVEMVELSDVTTVLREADGKATVSKEGCAKSCLEDCNCVAALYDTSGSAAGGGGGGRGSNIGECYVYGVAMGVKQAEAAEKGMLTYMVKVKKGSYESGRGKSGLKRWVAVLVGVVDGFVVLCVVGGIGYYYLIRRRRKETDGAGQSGPGNNET